jgi:preprotein translocase subunit SecG
VAQQTGAPARLNVMQPAGLPGTAAPDLPPPAADQAAPIAAPPAAYPPVTLLRRVSPARPRELVAMISIVALADLALYQGEGGAGLAALFAGTPAILFVTATARTSSSRLAAITTLLALVAGRCLWQSSTATAALGLALLLGFAIALRSSRSFLPELLASALGSIWGASRQFGGFVATLLRLARPGRLGRPGSAAYYVPAVLVVVFAAIFAAANPVIQGWLGSAAELFDELGWAPSPLHFAFWGACAVATAALLRPAIRSFAGLDARMGTAHASEPTGQAPAASRLALARNGMIALNVLFLGYNALDAVYLWGGRAPSGVTHTEYAHAGTAWLTVAFVLSTIVLGAVFRGPIEHDPRGKLARELAYAWAGQNLILAAGTFRRITMYISYSGLTELRIVGILGTSLATLGLVIVVYKLARHRTMLWVLRRQLDALAIAVAVYLVAPTGALVMRYNAARIADDQNRPLLHLYEQPIRPEAVPELLPLLDHPDPAVRQGVAVILVTQRERLAADDARTTSWMDFELARYQALRALDAAAAQLFTVTPIDRHAASARLRGVAYGINNEVEREGDEGPFDWRRQRYAPQD